MSAASQFLIRDAANLYKAGRVADAANACDNVLLREPRNFSALHLRGLTCAQQGNYADACIHLAKALEVEPRSALAQCDLGLVLKSRGSIDAAAARYRAALKLDPNFFEANNRLANLLVELRNYEEAVVFYRHAVRLRPDFAPAYNNLGVLLTALKRYAEARVHCQRALELAPDNADAHYNLGNLLAKLGQHEDALACFRSTLQIKPDMAQAHNNIGNALAKLGRRQEAIASYQRAVDIQPGLAAAHMNLGSALANLKRHDEAAACYRRALGFDPDSADIYANLGTVLLVQKQFEESFACFQRAAALQPSNGYVLGQSSYVARQICAWATLDDLDAKCGQSAQHERGAVYPFVVLSQPSTPAEQLHVARNFLRQAGMDGRPPLWHGQRYTHGKIRIGYLSADFHEHATTYLMAELFETHDRSQFELFAFSFGPDDQSPMRGRLKRAFDRFLDIGELNDLAAARVVSQHEIDIAVDLKGYTQDARVDILAHRPAPLQVNYLGYPGTMGADFIDYIVADPVIAPFEEQPFYAERIVHLPDCYQPNDRKRPIAERTPSRAECGLPERGFVFCSFNNNFKIAPVFFNVWMRLLKATPGSVLWLLRDNPWAEANLRKEAAARGVAPERLVFAPRVALADHLARHRLADLFLDTLPYNAHTTASDALWAGLPVLTCMGQVFASRVAASLLRAIGMPELIARSLEEYEALALRLASDEKRLAAVRAKLQRNRLSKPLFDTDRFRRHLEAAYLEMWRIWQSGEAPRAFAVEPRD
jgi:predicted O-linked N-acetylglucosamine transferase (SPINDLY family)